MPSAERKNEIPKRPEDFDPLEMIDIGRKMLEGRRTTRRERLVLDEFLQSRSKDHATAISEMPSSITTAESPEE